MTDEERIVRLLALRFVHLRDAAMCGVAIATIKARRSFERFQMAYSLSEMQDEREMDNRLVDLTR